MDVNSILPFQVVGTFGIVIAVAVNLAPIFTFLHFFVGKSTGDVSGLRHVAAFAAASMWVLYGLPQVTQNAGVILTSNAVGVAVQIFYLTVFLFYAQKDKRRNVLYGISMLVLFASFGAMITPMLVDSETVLHSSVGVCCVIFGIVACACPLSRMRTAARTKSWESLPIVEYWLLLISGIIWTWYGIILGDAIITVPNLFGVVVGLILLSGYYPNRNRGAEEGTVVNNSSLDHLAIEEPVKGAGNSKFPSSPPSAPSYETSGLPV